MSTSAHQQAIQQDHTDLLSLARWFGEQVPASSPAIHQWTEQATAMLTEFPEHPAIAERHLDQLANQLRMICLRSAHRVADPPYRSPPQSQTIRSASGRRISFGYERELEPLELEERCKSYHPCPQGWNATHLLFSSGQTALTSLLLCLFSRKQFPGSEPIKFCHSGGYFETTALLSLLQDIRPLQLTRNKSTELIGGSHDIDLIEPVFYDGAGAIKTLNLDPALSDANRQLGEYVIFDTTLVGSLFPLGKILSARREGRTKLVACVNSGLKLDQAGLELSNVGIVSLYSPSAGDLEDLAAALRRIRGLTGGGLGFDNMQALEAPWFLDRTYQQKYAQRIFRNNAALAQSFDDDTGLFQPLSHPALGKDPPPWAVSPFCIFQLRQPSKENYHWLDRRIAAETERRQLVFDRGGSFGFRGHRYEVIIPEDETPAFLRVAMGARAGWSCDGIIRLLQDISREKPDFASPPNEA